MSLHNKILDIVDAVKFKVDDVLFSDKLKVAELVDLVKYDVLKKDDFSDLVEEKPKKKRKTRKKKK